MSKLSNRARSALAWMHAEGDVTDNLYRWPQGYWCWFPKGENDPIGEPRSPIKYCRDEAIHELVDKGYLEVVKKLRSGDPEIVRLL